MHYRKHGSLKKCINSLHDDFVGFGVAKVDESVGIIQGRYSGGVAMLWRKELSKYIRIIEQDSDWCMAIELDMGSTKCVVLNIYMPYQSVDNEELYVEKLGYIKTFLDEIQCTNYAVIGDWNANLGISGTMTFREPMLDFCRESDLLISSHLMLPNNSHTHIHMYNSNIHYSWLDHVVSSHDFHQSVRDLSICYDITDEDRIPLRFVLSVDNLPATSDTVNDTTAKIR